MYHVLLTVVFCVLIIIELNRKSVVNQKYEFKLPKCPPMYLLAKWGLAKCPGLTIRVVY